MFADSIRKLILARFTQNKYSYNLTNMAINSVYETAYRGDFNQVKVKLDANPALFKTADENGRLLLHWAAIGGNENLVDYLIDGGCPVNSVDDTNSSPLTLASSAGRYEVVKLLIDRGANINHRNNRGQSSLHYACSKGHFEVAKLLIKAGVNVNDTDVYNATALHRAAAQGRSNIVELLLQAEQINFDICDSTGSTPLHLACEEDREAVACLLIKAGANTSIQNKEKKIPIELCSEKLKRTLSAYVN